MAQLDNAADSDSEDRGFESLRAGQEISRLTEAGDFFLKRRDSKDERDRATVRWTDATASDQAPAGARIMSGLEVKKGRRDEKRGEGCYNMKRTSTRRQIYMDKSQIIELISAQKLHLLLP